MEEYGGMPTVWLCVAVLTALPELFFRRYRSVWCSVAAGASVILALCSVPTWGQIAVFAVLSAVLLWFSRGVSSQVRCADLKEELTRSDPAFSRLSADGYEKGEIENGAFRNCGNLEDRGENGRCADFMSVDRGDGGLFP